MVFEDANNWFADDGKLTKIFCERNEENLKFDENDCCACDEAKYNVSIVTIKNNLSIQIIAVNIRRYLVKRNTSKRFSIFFMANAFLGYNRGIS